MWFSSTTAGDLALTTACLFMEMDIFTKSLSFGADNSLLVENSLLVVVVHVVVHVECRLTSVQLYPFIEEREESVALSPVFGQLRFSCHLSWDLLLPPSLVLLL